MRDLCGNILAEGQMVLWRSHGLVGHIIQVDEPVIENRPPRIVLAIAVPLVPPHGASPANLCVDDLVRLVDPKTTAVVEGLMAREGKPQ